jgi:ribosomal RNA-processing protein 7
MLREHATQLRDAVSLGREADAYMEEFDREAEEEIRERQRKANEPDEDGFVTVSYKKRRGGGSSLGGGAIIPEGRTSKRPRKKKEMELTNFYRFQVREAKRDQLAKLREKFEADKEKVQRMKEARQFKPF